MVVCGKGAKGVELFHMGCVNYDTEAWYMDCGGCGWKDVGMVRYGVNALRCDVWLVCACLPVGLVACFIGFGGSIFWWKCIPP